MKSLDVMGCPSDSAARDLAPVGNGWAGRTVSYAVNGYTIDTWEGSFKLHGVMGMTGWGDWYNDNNGANALSAITRPSESVMLTEKWSSDLLTFKDPGG